MSRDRLADAYEEQAATYARLADATAQIAHELRGIETPAARAGVDPAAEGAPVPSPAPSSAAAIPLKPQVDAGLSICPIHGVPWTVKAAGVSKAGKRYNSFWKCAEKDQDGFCNEKPQPIWIDTHPPVQAAA